MFPAARPFLEIERRGVERELGETWASVHSTLLLWSVQMGGSLHTLVVGRCTKWEGAAPFWGPRTTGVVLEPPLAGATAAITNEIAVRRDCSLVKGVRPGPVPRQQDLV